LATKSRFSATTEINPRDFDIKFGIARSHSKSKPSSNPTRKAGPGLRDFRSGA